jgi:hypothetical protein
MSAIMAEKMEEPKEKGKSCVNAKKSKEMQSLVYCFGKKRTSTRPRIYDIRRCRKAPTDFLAAEECRVESLVLIGNDFPSEVLPPGCLGGSCHALASLGIFPYLVEQARSTRDVRDHRPLAVQLACAGKQPSASRPADNFSRVADIGDEEWSRGRRRLKKHQRRAFDPGRKEQKVCTQEGADGVGSGERSRED